MNGGSFGYLIKQGITSLWRNKVMAVASTVILTASLIIIGGAVLLGINVRDIFINIEGQNEIVVFIEDEASQDQIELLGISLGEIEHIETIRFVSREEALEIMREKWSESAHLLDGLENDNPLPNAYYVSMDNLAYLGEALKTIEKLPAVESISAPTQLADILSKVKNILTIAGIAIITMLTLVSVVIINNTIKITVFSRRREINIMKYVGATNRFIRLPFVVEGLAIGLISALLASVTILLIYQGLSDMLENAAITWMSGVAQPIGKIWYWLVGGFTACGMLIGAFGSAAAIRKHLKV